MKVGYTKAMPTLNAEGQYKRLLAFGIEPEYIWGDAKKAGWTITECISSLREGDELCVDELAVLAYPKKRKLPRDQLKERMVDIAAKGAVIVEVSTGRSFKPDEKAVNAIFDAVERFRGSGQKSRLGRRPVHNYTVEQWQRIAGVWRDPKYKNEPERVEVIRALGEAFKGFNRAAWFSKNNPLKH